MSTTETDFWSRIDSEPAAADDPQPSAAGASHADGNEPDDTPQAERTESSELESSEPAAAASELRVARPAEPIAEMSKSKRIREFLAARPEVRNRDIVEALGAYGVTAADVSNVRTQLRKKAEKQQKAKSHVESSAAPRSPAPSRPAPTPARGPARSASRGGAAAASSHAAPAAGEIAMSEIEAGLSFIEQAGSLERARQVVELIARIRDISLTR